MFSLAAAALLTTGFIASSVGAENLHGHHQHLHKKDDGLSWAFPTASEPADCQCVVRTIVIAPSPTANASSSAWSSSVTSTSTWSSSSSIWTSSSTSIPTSTSTWSSTSTSTWTTSTSSSSSSSSVAPTTSSTSTSTSVWVAPSSSSTSTWVASSSSSSSTTCTDEQVAAATAVSDTISKISSSSSGSAGTIAANGNLWAMTYTPYNNDGTCKTALEVAADMAVVKAKGFTTVRTYATDCSGPENIGAAAQTLGLKMILGIYIDGSGIGSATSEQVNTLTSWGKNNWNIVEMVVAGNEAVFNNFVTASELASFISSVKSSFQAAGYNGPVTTTEPMNVIQSNGETFCSVVDVIAANIHPFFNTATTADEAGTFVATSLGQLSDVCNGAKEAYNLETGWPWKGNANGAAVPGVEQQKTAVDAIVASAGKKSAIFSFSNDAWKTPGSLDVEQYWGAADLFAGN